MVTMMGLDPSLVASLRDAFTLSLEHAGALRDRFEDTVADGDTVCDAAKLHSVEQFFHLLPGCSHENTAPDAERWSRRLWVAEGSLNHAGGAP